MQEFKGRELHSGSSTGKIVTNPKQAIAIAYSEQKHMPAALKASHASHPNASRLGGYLHPKKGR